MDITNSAMLVANQIGNPGFITDSQGVAYPLLVANDTVAAQAGIRYYIHALHGSIMATGNHYVQATIDGVLRHLLIQYSAAAISASISLAPGVLCDVNTAITYTLTPPATGTPVIIYAEIPA